MKKNVTLLSNENHNLETTSKVAFIGTSIENMIIMIFFK